MAGKEGLKRNKVLRKYWLEKETNQDTSWGWKRKKYGKRVSYSHQETRKRTEREEDMLEKIR